MNVSGVVAVYDTQKSSEKSDIAHTESFYKNATVEKPSGLNDISFLFYSSNQNSFLWCLMCNFFLLLQDEMNAVPLVSQPDFCEQVRV